jgi:hypothetical protein
MLSDPVECYSADVKTVIRGGDIVERDKLLERLNDLYETVWGEDIPNPTIPEYRELHEKMQKIMKEIKNLIDEVQKSED